MINTMHIFWQEIKTLTNGLLPNLITYYDILDQENASLNLNFVWAPDFKIMGIYLLGEIIVKGNLVNLSLFLHDHQFPLHVILWIGGFELEALPVYTHLNPILMDFRFLFSLNLINVQNI